MKLDVVVPTYNRSRLLRAAVTSLLRAPVPAGLEVNIFVIDNNSRDDTPEVVRELQAGAALPVHYFREFEQGSSQSRNRGIAESSGDLVGFIDDDEEIDPIWYEVVEREFRNSETEFIGGPYIGKWVSPRPDWLPPGYHAAIGHIPPKPRGIFGSAFGAVLMGGNAVIRRSVFQQVGTYSPHLGRSGKGLLSEEDAEFCQRLEAASVRGVYVPDLIIHHYIDPSRLTRHYHRRWVFWRAVSQGLRNRVDREKVKHFGGIPRYRIGHAIRSLLRFPVLRARRRQSGEIFACELAVWDLVGFVYGRRFANPAKYY